jgi:D-3-phosphoglycerate dehydrogenase
MISDQRKKKALITMSMTQSQIDRLEAVFQIQRAGWGVNGTRLSEEKLCELAADIDILLVGYENVTRKVIQCANNLKLIGVSRSNPVNVDIDAANERHIPVLHAPGRNSTAAAEYTIGLMIDQARHITRGDSALRAGKYLNVPMENYLADNPCNDVTWDLDGDTPYTGLRGFELAGKTLGLIGFGNVAAKVAVLAKAFEMRVITHTPERDLTRAQKSEVPIVPLRQLLRESDFISIHSEVNPETVALMDAKAISQMKPSAFIINTARACILDQQALIEALEQGRIAGAALDVFWYEPLPANHPLLKMENVILTPHLAGSTHEVPERHSRMIADDVLAWVGGKTPKHAFNKKAFE